MKDPQHVGGGKKGGRKGVPPKKRKERKKKEEEKKGPDGLEQVGLVVEMPLDLRLAVPAEAEG